MTGDSEGPQGQPHQDDMTDALGAEAARLAEAFTAWVGERAPTDSEQPDGPDEESPTASNAAAAAPPVCGCGSQTGVDVICRMCPICRAAEFLQTVRPEVLERCADVLAMIAGSLQAIAADRPGQRPSSSSPPPPRDSRSAHGDGERTATPYSSREPEAGIPIPVRGDEDPGNDSDDRKD